MQFSIFHFPPIMLLCLIFAAPSSATPVDLKQLLEKIEAQEKLIGELQKRVEELESTESSPQSDDTQEHTPNEKHSSKVNVGYRKGFFISQSNNENESFELQMNSRMQFRYTGFRRRGHTYALSNEGASGEQPETNDFEIERGRLEFRGHFLDPNMQYYLNLDFDTDDNHEVIAHDFWFNYVFNDAFNLHAGKAFVPGSREWLDGSTTTHLADRSLATSFFRPDRSLGLWVIGEPVENVFYRAMMANGFNTTDLERDEIDGRFTYSASLWSDLFGNYGNGSADLEFHEELAVRVGTSFTYSPVDDGDRGEPIGEADAIRLSNGIRLNAPGALAPETLVDDFDIFLYAIDAAAKYYGVSLNSEAYFRSIESVKGIAGESFESFIDRGVTVDVGYFLIPSFLETVVRYSHIDGAFGNSSEYAWGLNYFVSGSHKNKFTFDISRLDESPVSSSGPNYLVGATGLLYRGQWQIAF